MHELSTIKAKPPKQKVFSMINPWQLKKNGQVKGHGNVAYTGVLKAFHSEIHESLQQSASLPSPVLTTAAAAIPDADGLTAAQWGGEGAGAGCCAAAAGQRRRSLGAPLREFCV